MSTIMEERIKQAFEEWKQTEVKEHIMATESRNQSLSNLLMDKIKQNPGITGKELRTYISKEMPSVPVSYVPAILKGFYDGNMVNRIQVDPDGEKGRTTFSYTAIPEAVRANMPKREKVKAYTKKTKKVKTHPKPKEDKGISSLVPAERTERIVINPLAVGPTTLHITISTSQGAYSMKLDEAKFIYQQLNQIFGGAR